MSLFGSSPDAAPRPQAKSSLFADDAETPATPRSSKRDGGGGGLFADDGDAAAAASGNENDSPWGLISPRKSTGRADVVKNLLSAGSVPEYYIDTYDMLLSGGESVNGGVSMAGVRRVLDASELGSESQESILRIVEPTGKAASLGRGEFNVLLALVGLAQEGEDVSLDGVDERRRRLPTPSIPSLKPSRRSEVSHAQASVPPASKSTRQTGGAPLPETYNFPDSDPWSSAGGKQDPSASVAQTQSNGATRNVEHASTSRTTSSFTTSEYPSSTAKSRISNDTAPTTSNNSWGIYDSAPGGGFGNADLSGGGDGGFDDEHTQAASLTQRQSRAPGTAGRTNQGVEEVATVVALPEKEGMFLFQYRNYEVASTRRNSKVVRRFSDFVWLLDCLHKKYPFRQLPLLPPKRVAINGNHIAADALFIEKRRRGLVRFVNALVRHPVLSQEQLFVMFLTVPTELSVWRKQAAVSVQEEFSGKTLPPQLEESLPVTLNDLFDTVRSGVRRSMETYIGLCTLVERLIKRREGLCGDYARLSQTLGTLTETSEDTYRIDTNDVPMLNEGLHAAAKHIDAHQRVVQDEARGWDEGVLEDLKRQRDGLVSMRDMFDRRDKLARDNIPQLERRIASNEGKLSGVRAKLEAQRKAGEAEKLEEAIMKDKESIVAQHARGVLVRECIRDEIRTFATSQYHVSRLHQDWAHERARFAERQVENWKALAEQVEGMPVGES